MANISFDSHSLIIDGRRVWLVSGGVSYARTPRAEWADRLHAARQAGFNCVSFHAVWSRHEIRPGHFDFTGENDVRHFVELIQQMGLMCIVRPGPYIGAGFDNGGLPPWLMESETMRLRTNSQAFLESCSRYITALAGQLRTLQAVTSGSSRSAQAQSAPGPIVLLQNESGWYCGHDALAASYLGELNRYYREAGFAVPIINTNDLWQSVEGEIDGWTGAANMLSHLRQLGAVRPNQPRIVMDMRLTPSPVVDEPAGLNANLAERRALRALAEVIAGGGQYNLCPLVSGTNFGFAAGRDPDNLHAFPTTAGSADAPIDELGRPGPSYSAVRKISTFASRFNRLLTHAELNRPAVALQPGWAAAPTAAGAANHTETAHAKGRARQAPVSVVHMTGTQGDLVFLFKSGNDPAAHDDGDQVHTLVAPDGSLLPVDMSGRDVAWVLLDARLTGRAQLDYCNLSAFALVGKTFVCFGASGSRGMLSINGSPLETLVPGPGKPPFVHEHEGLTVIVAADEHLAHIHLTDDKVFVGVAGLTREGRPVPLPDTRSCTVIDAEGRITTHKFGQSAPAPTAPPTSGRRSSAKVVMGEWEAARTDEHWAGTSPRFAAIDGPADLVALGAPYGYGWYRFTFAAGAKKVRLAFPHAAHRMHVAVNGKRCGLVGFGPSADNHADVPAKKGATMVVLAENAGRVWGGPDLGEHTGWHKHAWVVAPVRTSKPKLVAAEPVDLLKFRAPLWGVHEDDVTDARRLTWTIQHRRRTPIIMRIEPFLVEGMGAWTDEARAGASTPMPGGVVLLNDKPVAFITTAGRTPLFFDAEQLSRGNNVIQIAMIGSTEAAAARLAKSVRFEEGVECATEKGEWAFAKWEPPHTEAFGKPARAGTPDPSAPAWWRATFSVPASALTADPDGGHASAIPVWLETAGLSKGQIFVNGRHLCRYWAGDANGKTLGPQKRCWIPVSFLKPGPNDTNHIMIFDEHGRAPTKARVVADAALHAIE
ncbi:MAG: beta-galactosidase [Phycisphaeraceae bacterium]|nr:beta-galactosidase [Phycisphaeraceae bacterium]